MLLAAAIGFPVIIMLLIPLRALVITRLPFGAEELAILDRPTASPFVSHFFCAFHPLIHALPLDHGVRRRIPPVTKSDWRHPLAMQLCVTRKFHTAQVLRPLCYTIHIKYRTLLLDDYPFSLLMRSNVSRLDEIYIPYPHII
jgi:hypothetical protein